jgi:hypothetical protein
MKVKCVRILDSAGKEIESSPWLTLGRIYHVMTIYIESDKRRSYRIISNNRDPGFATMGYHSAECFEIVSDVIPSNWRVKIYKMADIDISPEAWQVPGFLEDFYDADPKAYSIFERERDVILSEDP